MINLFNFKNKKLKKVYEYALEKTKKDIYQGVEGLFHNLNTLERGAL